MSYADPLQSQSAGQNAQNSLVIPLDGLGSYTDGTAIPAIATDTTGAWLNVRGIGGIILWEVAKTGTGTFSVAFQGTFDSAAKASSSSNIASLRYAVLGASGALSEVVVATAYAATNPLVKWFAISPDNFFPTISLVTTSTSGTYSLTSRVYVIPA